MAIQATALIYPVMVEDVGALEAEIRAQMPGLNLYRIRVFITSAGPETHVYVINASAGQKSGVDQLVGLADQRPITVETRVPQPPP